MTHSLIFRWYVKSLADTAALAQRFAALLRPGDVVALGGTLGAGKTAYVRAVIRSLAREDIDVPSPTYNLLLTYDFEGFCLYHYDLYRLESPEEAIELDIDEAFDAGVSLIEWPDRLGRYLPEEHLLIEIMPDGEDESSARIFSFFGSDQWRQRLALLEDAGDA